MLHPWYPLLVVNIKQDSEFEFLKRVGLAPFVTKFVALSELVNTSNSFISYKI